MSVGPKSQCQTMLETLKIDIFFIDMKEGGAHMVHFEHSLISNQNNKKLGTHLKKFQLTLKKIG